MAHTHYRNITSKTDSQKSTKTSFILIQLILTHTKAVLVYYHYKVVNTAIIFAILMEVSLFQVMTACF